MTKNNDEKKGMITDNWNDDKGMMTQFLTLCLSHFLATAPRVM